MTTTPNPTPTSQILNAAADLAGQFTMQYDADRAFPFIEDENANITGYGHQDPAVFAAEINRYDAVCNGEPYPEDEQWDADWIGHWWVTLDADGERLHRASESDEGAFPVTGLWGQR